MIDLHLHTTASDGRCSPTALVQRVHEAGVRVFAVTDHDTVAGHAEAEAAASATASVRPWHRDDGGVRGSGRARPRLLDRRRPQAFAGFLREQRARRVARVEAIGAALAAAGARVDLGPVLARIGQRPGTSVGRPDLARLVVAAGHASSIQEAFDRWLGEGCPAYVARTGVSPEQAVSIDPRGRRSGVAGPPGVTRRNDRFAAWAAAGLDALEAYHSDHSEDEEADYLERARALALLVTGGSDFHGDDPMSHRTKRRVVGGVTLPTEGWSALQARHMVTDRHA